MNSAGYQLLAIICVFASGVNLLADQAQTLFRNRDGYNAYRIPAIVQAANGDLLAFCEARQGGDASEIDIVLRRSTDLGQSWGRVLVVQDNTDFEGYFSGSMPPITIGNPAPVVDLLNPDQPGRIWLPFTLENDRVFVTYSDDHGLSWSGPREITSNVKLPSWGWYATGPVHSIQLQQPPHRGRLIVPADHRIGAGGADRGACGAHVLYSDDFGATWLLGAVDDSYEDGLEANETTVVELNDGRLYFNTRDQNGPAPGTRGAAYSSDGGLSWDHPDDSRYQAFVPLPEPFDPPVVQCALLRVWSTRNGDPSNLILFSGPDESGPYGAGRSDLSIRYSTDETQSWHDGALIHAGPAAYSDLVKLGNRVGILYEAGNPGTDRYDRIDFQIWDVTDLLN